MYYFVQTRSQMLNKNVDVTFLSDLFIEIYERWKMSTACLIKKKTGKRLG